MRICKFSIPTVVAMCVFTAYPENPNKDPQASASTSAQQKQLSQEDRNQQSTFDPQRVSDTELKKSVSDINKASTFTKMAVQNLQNEKLGTVNDLVFDPETGKISYAVLSVGGFLGVGDKLVAVPLTSLRPQPGQNYLVLNMTKDELKSAPGLAKNSWPRLNDPSLGSSASFEKSSASSANSPSAQPSSSGSSASAESKTSSDKSSSSEKSSLNDQSSSSDKSSSNSSSETAKSSDQLSSSDKTSPSSTSSKDAQGSSPSASSSSGQSSTETSGKDSGASDSSNSSTEKESSSSTPKS
jgi:sporulation protein YlmC with PRC-barrel domain